MPSHQERIRQNNCDHQWYHYHDQLDKNAVKEYRKCVKCEKIELVSKNA